MSGAVWINGSFVERSEAHVGAFDAGLQHGVGLFETMLARSGEVIDLGRHLDRLRDSAAALRLSDDLRVPAIAEAVNGVVKRAGLEKTRVRLTLTGGDLNLLSGGGGPTDPTVLIDAQPATDYPEGMYESGVATVIADRRDNPLDPYAGHKTLNYWPRLGELQKASAKNAGEAITLQVSNHLSGGCVSNLFVVKGDELHTPVARAEEEPGAIASPVLPGVTRSRVLDWADGLGLSARVRLLAVDDLLDADEAFLTNSSWGVLPVVRVEASTIGAGKPGRVAREMLAKWRQLPED